MITDLEGEVWKDISGYEGRYMISNKGRVKSIRYGKEMLKKFGMNHKGYYQVSLGQRDGKKYQPYVHKLVATAFIPNPNKLPMVNHMDEIKTHNYVENLEWCDNRYNCTYGTALQRAMNTRNLKHRKTREKPILQFTLDGELVAEYKSIHECARQTGFNAKSLPHALKRRYGNNKLYGFLWDYKNDDDR